MSNRKVIVVGLAGHKSDWSKLLWNLNKERQDEVDLWESEQSRKPKAFIQYERSREEFVLYRRYKNGEVLEIARSINESALTPLLKEELAK